MKKIECEICGDDLSLLGPLALRDCKKCDVKPICPYCVNVHECAQSEADVLYDLILKAGKSL